MIYERLNHNYSYYFITILTKHRKHFFGEIKNGKMKLTSIGMIAHLLWQETINNRSFLHNDAFVVMPDHFHGILAIDKELKDSILKEKPELEGRNILEYKIMHTVRSFKSAVKKYANIFELDFMWLEGYHNEFIWSEKELDNTRNYINNNVINWKVKK